MLCEEVIRACKVDTWSSRSPGTCIFPDALNRPHWPPTDLRILQAERFNPLLAQAALVNTYWFHFIFHSETATPAPLILLTALSIRFKMSLQLDKEPLMT
jgi:hypothetical protein